MTPPVHTDEVEVDGVTEQVEIVRDPWGVSHIRAASIDDVFFAQGFNAARDRLFQMDLWRRRGLGRMAAAFGEEWIEPDRAARLFLFRGSMDDERSAYGPVAWRALSSFVAGVNAYVQWCSDEPARLPVEFKELSYRPDRWSPEDIVRIRAQALYQNVEDELARAITLRDHNDVVEHVRRPLEPATVPIVPDGLDLNVLSPEILRTYRLATTPWSACPGSGVGESPPPGGSNSWVIGPARTASGRPILANDPHRIITVPSLRYITHLTCPGFDVIGAGEPVLPGVAIGHNGKVAFGLTVFSIDQEDLYVYETRADSPSEYRYGDGWERIRTVRERLQVAGRPDTTIELRFTRHGPVVHEDPSRRSSFAVRAAWLEVGATPYLGCLAYLDADDGDAFAGALQYWRTPGENHVYADSTGRIGYRAAGLVPIRPNWDGLLPVPGDGRYEWAGFRRQPLPSETDPARGWIATANEMNLPEPDRATPSSYEWLAPFRKERITEVLHDTSMATIEDSLRLQVDTVSVPAGRIIAMTSPVLAARTATPGAWRLLDDWDADLSAESPAAALFEVWYRRHLRTALRGHALASSVPDDALDDAIAATLLSGLLLSDARTELAILEESGIEVASGDSDLATLIERTLLDAYGDLTRLLGPEPSSWKWGDLHVARFRHSATQLLAVPPPWTMIDDVPRGGSDDTVDATPYDDDFVQVAGASFRVVIDVGNWDASIAVNAPGQSGDPSSPHYQDLVESWASGSGFPLLYSRAAVDEHAVSRLKLVPSSRKR